MIRTKYVVIEYEDWGGTSKDVDDLASDFGLTSGEQQSTAGELGQHAVRTYAHGRSWRRADQAAGEIADYLARAAPHLGWCVWVHPPMPRWEVGIRQLLSLLWWTVRNPRGPDRGHNLYLLRCSLRSFGLWLSPFERCECGGFTKVLWRRRDPHFRNGKWVGPDSCLPF